jgi:hypothetical protein
MRRAHHFGNGRMSLFCELEDLAILESGVEAARNFEKQPLCNIINIVVLVTFEGFYISFTKKIL